MEIDKENLSLDVDSSAKFERRLIMIAVTMVVLTVVASIFL